jgi:hypothetical protein
VLVRIDELFLDLLDPEDDPPTATEALAEGPWTVVREGDHSDDEQPAGTFVHLHPAGLATAAVPIAARDAAYRLDRERVCATPGRPRRRPPAVAPPRARRRAQPPRRPGALPAGARRGARGGGGDGGRAGRGAAGEEVGMSWFPLYSKRTLPAPKVYSPHGGVDGLIARGVAELGDPGEEARQRRGAR